MSQFTYLTGRRLASFKRDFECIFNISPNPAHMTSYTCNCTNQKDMRHP
jgi:hypothetical protein